METTIDTKDVEIWKGATDSTVTTLRTDHLGQISKVRTKGRSILRVTPFDRALNQDRVRNVKHDPFSNGLLEPVQIVDKEAAEKAAKNPNVHSESDLAKMLKAPIKTFAADVKAMESEAALRRLKKFAADKDIAPSRQEFIQARLDEVTGGGRIRDDEDE